MDFQAVINELTQHMDEDHWGIEGIVYLPDLSGHQKQKTDMDLLPVEYVIQRGSEETGGFFGKILFPLNGYPDGDGGNPFLKIWFG